MAAFKHHCAFGFWKGALILNKRAGAGELAEAAMGQFGHLTAVSDLPNYEVLTGYVKEAARLNEAGIKLPAKSKPKEKKDLIVPDYLMAALKKNKKALTTFEAFSYSHKKEYVEWITEAKAEDTRKKRLNTALAWMAAGKPRHWKYLKC